MADLKPWLKAAWRVRGCIGLMLVALVLLVPSQLQDMMQALAETTRAAVMFHVAWLMLALSGWYWARATLAMDRKVADTADAVRATLTDAQRPVFEWLPRGLFGVGVVIGLGASLRGGGSGLHLVLTLVFAAIGFVVIWKRRRIMELIGMWIPCLRFVPKAFDDPKGGWFRRHVVWPVRALVHYAPFPNAFAALFLLASTVLLLVSTIDSFAPLSATIASSLDTPKVAFSLVAWFGWLFPGPSAALAGLAFWMPALTAIVVIANAISFPQFNLRWGNPFEWVLLVVLFTTPQWLKVHNVRVVTVAGARTPADRPSLEAYLRAWAQDCGVPKDAVLRPVIIAVSGGATRAAIWAARVLDDVQSAPKMPGTGVFAVSSVSGGSLGTAAWFSALAGRTPPVSLCGRPAPDAAAVADTRERYLRGALVRLGGDALGPGLAGLILADPPRDILGPLVALGRGVENWIRDQNVQLRGGDRAEAIEHGFAQLWQSAADASAASLNADESEDWPEGAPLTFDAPYLSLFPPRDHGTWPGPLWIGNSTDAQNGFRVLTTPFRPIAATAADPTGGWPFRDAKDALALVGADLAIATVLNNTARFPVLEPTGALVSVRAPDPADRHAMEDPTELIDGGYFENEGIMTAFELAQWLRTTGSAVLQRRIAPIIVQATSDADVGVTGSDVVRCGPEPLDDPSVSEGGALPSQALAPLMGVMNVRSAHSQWLLRLTRDHYCRASAPSFFHFYLYRPANEDVPLNWVLSDRIAEYIWHTAITLCGNRQERERMHAVLAGQPVGDVVGQCKP